MKTTITDEELLARRAWLTDAVAGGESPPIVVGPSADLGYLVGKQFSLSDRPVLLVVAPSGPVLVAPLLEASEFPPPPSDMRIATWEDGESLAATVVDLVDGASTLAIADGVPFWLADQLSERVDRLIAAGPRLQTARARKSADEIELMRIASRAADLTYEALRSRKLEGLSELQVSAMINDLLVEHGCDPGTSSSLVASGPEAAAPHHWAGERVLCAGDGVIIDFGGSVGGYYSDSSRAFAIGGASPELEKIHRVVLEANQAAFARVAPGVSFEEIDAAAREVVESHGYGHAFLHRTGHGIGLEVHEHPYVVRGNSLPLEEGMTFTIEPGVYIEGVGGVRIEDVVLVTADGGESLNRSPRELLVVE